MGLDDTKWIIRIEDVADLFYWDEIYTDDLEEAAFDFTRRQKDRPGLVIKWIMKV